MDFVLPVLSCHSQRVLINQNSSKSFDIDCSLPQGSCLGPILFVTYVSRIFSVVENHLPSIHTYAACISMYLSFKPLPTSSQHDALRASQACIADFRAFGIPKYQHDRVQRISNASARNVCLVHTFSHHTPVLYNLHWLPVPYQIQFKILLLVHRALFDVAPVYLMKLLSFKESRS